MKVVAATPHEISEWHSYFLRNCTDTRQALQVITGLGGDRLHAVCDGGGFFAKDGDEIIGVVSYSPTGEYHRPNIIGLWVKDHDVQVAVEIIRHAIDVLADVLKPGERIVVDVVFQDEHDAYTMSGLGKDYYDSLELRRHSLLGDT